MHIRACHYATGQPVELRVENGRIAAVDRLSGPLPDLAGQWLAPALFDLQINGCDGHSFNSPSLTVEDVRHVVGVCRQHGIGGLCATLVTNSEAALLHGFTTLRRACQSDPAIAHAIPALHLEGPYISPEDGARGAHPKQHVRPPNWDEFCRFQNAAEGRIRLVTLAPEHEGALPFIERLTANGIVVSIGHTNASGPRIREAIAAGAKLSTHLGNGAHAMLPRHDNYIWEQLAADELWASLICDGHHLPPAVIRCILRVKTPARSILTCDASPLAGLPPGRYSQWGMDFDILPTGRVVVSGTSYLAGSGAFTDLCVGHAIQHGGVSLAEAVDMAGARPRELLRLPPRTLDVGAAADLVLFDWSPGEPFRVRETLIGGTR